MKTLTPKKLEQLRRMFGAARQADQSGLINQAEQLYRDILKQASDAWDVELQLAMLLARSGRAVEAVKYFRRIVNSNPSHAPNHANLANALAQSNQYAEAIIEFERALTLKPDMLVARLALGDTLRLAGRPQDAATVFKAVLDTDGVNHAAYSRLGLVYGDLGDLPRAMECLGRAVGLAPGNADYRMLYAELLRQSKLESQAAEQLYEAVMLKPEWLDAVVLLGEVLQQQRRFDEAKECYERALQLKPNEPELIERIGSVCLDMGDAEHAISIFSEVLSQFPERYVAKLGLGRAKLEAGHVAEAAQALEELVSEYPDKPHAYFSLSMSRKFKPGDPLIANLAELAENMTENAPLVVRLNFALGKIYDDCGDWDRAWRHYACANRLRSDGYDYQPAQQEAKYDALVSVFDNDFITRNRQLGVPNKLPVFIVGMPRSGTTLTEQIISSHPDVIGAGEVGFWGSAYEAVPFMLKTLQPYPQCMELMTRECAQVISDRYNALLLKIAGHGANPARITDKMPHNFVQLGLIALLLPEVPIIHCKRDAMDNCLSIFFQNFRDSHPYAYDLASLGHHYRQYERLMAHWHDVFPGRIMDINYEDTIADPEFWSRKLIEHVGLEWNDACLAPHQQERTVKTASKWQVRQPIYKTSVARWKNYEQHLGPLKEALGYKG